VNIDFREAARDDLLREFRYLLVNLGLPAVAVRFREGVRQASRAIVLHPLMAPSYPQANSRLHGLRSWPVPGFPSIRLYYLVSRETIHVIRILHSKRDVRGILERQPG
jgi:toxin ParE1/3/4